VVCGFGSYQNNPWFVNFCFRLLKRLTRSAGFARTQSFPNAPPRYLRPALYEYHFTDFATRRKDRRMVATRAEGRLYASFGNPKAGSINRSFRPKQENGHADAMLNPAGGSAKKQIGQEAVSVRAHRHQTATLLLDPFDDFRDRIAVSQFCVRGNSAD